MSQWLLWGEWTRRVKTWGMKTSLGINPEAIEGKVKTCMKMHCPSLTGGWGVKVRRSEGLPPGFQPERLQGEWFNREHGKRRVSSEMIWFSSAHVQRRRPIDEKTPVYFMWVGQRSQRRKLDVSNNVITTVSFRVSYNTSYNDIGWCRMLWSGLRIGS